MSKALEINPEDSDAWFERAILRGAKSDLDQALADYAKTIELNPKNARAYANRGLIMLLRGQDASAKKEFDTALKIDSSLKAELEKFREQAQNVE